MQDPSIQKLNAAEAMEACRPGHADLDSPEMEGVVVEMVAHRRLEERFARLQQLDGVIADVVQNVPVPEGLTDRVLTMLPLQ